MRKPRRNGHGRQSSRSPWALKHRTASHAKVTWCRRWCGRRQQHPEAWLDLLEQAGVPAGPINTILQMHDDPQALAREMVLTQSHPDAGPVRTLGLPVKFSQTPGGPKQPASRYAEHTRSILHDVGYTDEEISTLIQSGVTVANEQPPEKP